MSHAVLGLGMAALTVSGSVWYLPAFAVLEAGDDRPVSQRIAAAATLIGWATAAAVAVLLFATGAWQPLAVLGGLGGTAVVLLAGWARVRAHREQREETQRWAALHQEPAENQPARTPRSFAGWTLSGLIAAWAAAIALLLAGGAEGSTAPVLAVSAAAAAGTVSAVSLLVAAVRSQALRHEQPALRTRAPRVPR